MFKYFSVLFIVIFSYFLFCPMEAKAASGISVSPASFVEEDIPNGIRIPKQVRVSRLHENIDEIFEPEVSGLGAQYIELTADKIEMPAGQTHGNYTFYIAPKDAPFGRHTAVLDFYRSKSEDGANSGAAFRQGIRVTILFTISDKQVTDFDIHEVNFRDTEVGNPVPFSFKIENNGNAPARPDQVKIKAVDITDSSHVYEETILGDTLESVLPRETGFISSQLDKDIPLGVYLVEVKFFANGKLLLTKKGLRFEVHPPGTLAHKASITKVDIGGEAFEIGSLIKLDAVMKNTGPVPTEGLLFIELSKDGQLIDLLQGEKKSVLPGQEGVFSKTFRLEDQGSYVAKSYFEYSAFRTNEVSTSFVVVPFLEAYLKEQEKKQVEEPITSNTKQAQVKESIKEVIPNVQLPKNIIYLIFGLLVFIFLLLVLLILLLIFKKRRRDKEQQVQSPQPMPFAPPMQTVSSVSERQQVQSSQQPVQQYQQRQPVQQVSQPQSVPQQVQPVQSASHVQQISQPQTVQPVPQPVQPTQSVQSSSPVQQQAQPIQPTTQPMQPKKTTQSPNFLSGNTSIDNISSQKNINTEQTSDN